LLAGSEPPLPAEMRHPQKAGWNAIKKERKKERKERRGEERKKTSTKH